MVRIRLKGKESIIYAKREEVVRMEADGSSTHFHLRDGEKITVSRSLKHWLKVLEPLGKFIRIHNSHAVNIHDVFALGANGITLRDEERTELPVSSTYKEEVQKVMDEACEQKDKAEVSKEKEESSEQKDKAEANKQQDKGRDQAA